MKNTKKSILLFAVAATLIFSSCGEAKEGEKKDSAPTVCDCVKMSEEMMNEMQEAGADEAKMKEIEEKYKETAEACKKLGEAAEGDPEAMKKLQEEASNCK